MYLPEQSFRMAEGQLGHFVISKVSLILSPVYSRTILVYSGIFTFLVDAYPSYAASALAANSFTRSTFAGVFPLFGSQSKGKDLKLLVRTILTFSFFGQCTINWVYTGPPRISDSGDVSFSVSPFSTHVCKTPN